MGVQQGFGVAALGTSSFGFGVPATTPPPGGAPLTDNNGVRQSVRKIDLKTRQYVYDANGRAMGDSPVHQQMQFIATTDLGSCAVLATGNTIRSLQDITANFVQRAQAVYQKAYARLVARGLIKINDISVEVTPSGPNTVSKALIRIKYTDLTTGQDQELTL